MGYRVVAGYVTVPHAVDGAVAHRDIPAGSILPDDVPDEDVRALLGLGHITEDEPEAPRKRTSKATK